MLRILVLSLSLMVACASRYSVQDDYNSAIEDTPYQSQKTVVFFLIDGLSVPTFEKQLKKNKIPSIKQHFLSKKNPAYKAHVAFPSVTFTNISSLLREKPVHQTGALGNTIIVDGKKIDFESALERQQFGNTIRGDSIFTRLARKGEKTVSLDYGLGADASVTSSLKDLNSGLAYGLHDYTYLDFKRIESLRLLLTETPTSKWPNFIFIHLVGLDLLSHQFGPKSSQSLAYLNKLDRNLEDVFDILQKAEIQKHEVVSLLSADHGYSPVVTEYVPIEKIISKIDPQLKIINDYRTVAAYYPTAPSSAQKKSWAKKLLKKPGIEIVSYRTGASVNVVSEKEILIFKYHYLTECSHASFAIAINDAAPVCPDKLDKKIRDKFNPYFIENLAYYFQATRYPDLLITPDETSAFKSKDRGYHGGPSKDEIIVPLLMRNANLSNTKNIPAIWELLQFL